MNKFKLTYTDEMKKQDKLWDTESEDVNVMEQLQKQIIDEAKAKGWKGVAVFWQGINQSIVDIANSQEEYENDSGIESHGNCRSVIARIEADMRAKENSDNTRK